MNVGAAVASGVVVGVIVAIGVALEEGEPQAVAVVSTKANKTTTRLSLISKVPVKARLEYVPREYRNSISVLEMNPVD